MGTISTENLSGLPLNQEWQRLLLEMIRSGVGDLDAVETMLSTALGNAVNLHGPQALLSVLLPICMGLAEQLPVSPKTAPH